MLPLFEVRGLSMGKWNIFVIGDKTVRILE